MRAFFFGLVWSAVFLVILLVFVLMSARIRASTGAAYGQIPRRTWVAIWVARVAIVVWFVAGFVVALRYG